MRLYLKLSKNKQIVPFDYQINLVGAVHKWLGENQFHDELSLYSLSWLLGSRVQGKELTFPDGADWFISSPDESFIKKILKGITENNEVAFGMFVKEVVIKDTPFFNSGHRFSVASPVFIKRSVDKNDIFYYYHQVESDTHLTETLKTKLRKMGFSDEGVKVRFDRNYQNAKLKIGNYKGINNKGSVCPIIIEGTPEQIGFAWDVGVGNSTGIGFGSLI